MPTVFVDRDGVINANRSDHVLSWDQMELLPGALDGLALLTQHGFRVVVVTNQAIVNRGRISQADLDDLHRRMIRAVERHGGKIDAVLACPHRPEEGCGCRKPAPGLLFRARDELGASLDGAVLIGDHLTDLEAARRAGCRSILVMSGRTAVAGLTRLPESCSAVAVDLHAAARHLVEQGIVRSEDDRAEAERPLERSAMDRVAERDAGASAAAGEAVALSTIVAG